MLNQKCGASIGEQGQDYLKRMLDATQRMQSLLTALLEYSRLSTRVDPFVEVDLKKTIHDVLSDLEIRIEKTGGEVRVPDFPTIQADPTQMRQLFQNLIGNGLKFHKEGVRPVVEVASTVVDDRTVRIIVKDNGIGFDERFLDKIFAPFQRLHGRSSQYKGTGMGLAICKKIVERHGGSITAGSTPGEGSTFIITLPMSSDDGDKIDQRCAPV
jgi:signal transduction histidine kinase